MVAKDSTKVATINQVPFFLQTELQTYLKSRSERLTSSKFNQTHRTYLLRALLRYSLVGRLRETSGLVTRKTERVRPFGETSNSLLGTSNPIGTRGIVEEKSVRGKVEETVLNSLSGVFRPPTTRATPLAMRLYLSFHMAVVPVGEMVPLAQNERLSSTNSWTASMPTPLAKRL